MSPLSKPKAGERIPPSSLAYFQTRTRLKLFNLIHERFEASKISQAELAKRLGKGTDRICRLLGAPGNWTIDTVSDLLFAIDGGLLDPHVAHPLDKAARNDTVPHWLNAEPLSPLPTPIAPATMGTRKPEIRQFQFAQ